MGSPFGEQGGDSPLALILGPVAALRDAAAPGSSLRAELDRVHANAVRLRDLADGERRRQQLLAVVGTALDRETTVPGRRTTLVRTLVDEALVDAARFVAVDEHGAGEQAVAARTPELEALMEALDVAWMQPAHTVEAGEVRRITVDEAFVRGAADERQRELRRRSGFHSAVLVPLATRGHPSGLLSVARLGASAPFDDADVALLTELGERAATAVDNALLLEREQAGNARLEALQRATAALSAAATPEQVARAAADQFALLAGATDVTLWRPAVAGGETVLEAVARDRPPVRLDGRGPVAAAARTGAPVWADADGDHLPLVAAGSCVGVVSLAGHRRDLRAGPALTMLAELCAEAVQRAGLLGAERSARHTAEELGEVVGALAGATTPAGVAAVVLDHVARLGATSAAVLLRRGEQLEALAGAAPARRLALDAGHPAAQAARTGEPVWAGGDPQVAVPLLLGGRTRPLGVLALRFAAPATLAVGDRAAVLTLAGQCAQALDRARLHQAEHDVAEVLQHSLLPRELPALPRLTVAARYLPSADGVAAGGDWYDVLPVDETRVAVAVGDVVGHGAAAAAVMGQLRSALAAYLLDGHCPAAALERLDRFARRVPGAAGSTCVCLVVDCATGALSWSRAGHPPVLLLEPAGPRYLDDGGGTVLGVTGRPPYPQARATMAPGSSVLLYTDGLVERRGEVVDDGQERLARAASAIRDLSPDHLVRVLADGAVADGELGDPAQPDDIALVAVRLVPAPLHGELPAQPRQLRVMRRAVEQWSAAVGLPDDVLDDLQYALGEAAANAVEHAYEGRAEGAFTFDLSYLPGGDTSSGPAAVGVEVRDRGRWRPIPVDAGYRGRGLQVLDAIGRDVRVDRGEGGTTVTFRVPVPDTAVLRRHPARPAPTPATPAVAVFDDAAVRLVGDLDLDGVASVRPTLLAALRPGELLLDLSDTAFVSSAGVALLIELVATARERRTALAVRVAPGSQPARVLDLTGLGAVLPVMAAV